MLKKSVVILCLLTLISLIYPVATKGIEVPSQSAILIEAKSGRVLYSKNIDAVLPMASTTKIMTAIVALEYGNGKDVVIIDKEAPYVEGSSLYLKENDEISLEDLLYGLMLRSGNDAAYTISKHIAGSEENFVTLMNEKAKIIGAKNTNFTNPHGLHADTHCSTAKDLVLITRYAFRNDYFKQIVSTVKKSIKVNHEERVIYSKNKLLTGYQGGNGVKTGYTIAAGKCLVFSAVQNDMEVIGVLLNANDIWEESRTLLDYAFNEYTPYNLVKKGEYIASIYIDNGINKQIKIISNEDIDIPIKQGENIRQELKLHTSYEAPIFNRQKIGSLDYYIEDELVYSKPLFSPQKVYVRDFMKFLKEIIHDFFTSQIHLPTN